MRHIIVYEWPDSQICMECDNRTEDILDDSAVACGIACEENDGVRCPLHSDPNYRKE